jgi:hypothetical protein
MPSSTFHKAERRHRKIACIEKNKKRIVGIAFCLKFISLNISLVESHT